MHSRWLRVLAVVALSLVGLVVAVGVVWLIDDRIVHGDTVARNVTLAGRPIGGLAGEDLAEVLDGIAAETATMSLVVFTPDRTLTALNVDAGISLDEEAVTAAALEVGRDGGVVDGLVSWVASFAGARRATPVYAFDDDVLTDWVGSHPRSIRHTPVEPSFTGSSGELVVDEGKSGAHLDPADVVAAVTDAVEAGRVPVSVDVPWSPLPPRVTPEALEEAVAAAEALAADPLTVRMEGEVARLGGDTIVGWIDSEQVDDRLEPRLDRDRIQESAERLLADLATEGSAPVFTIVDGEVEVEYGEPPLRCCDSTAGAVIAAALESGDGQVVDLPLVQVEDELTQVAKLGINEIVGEFTTNHACCEGRVENIHRIADLVRGVVIEPGDSFSINEHVGVRTREKGFVAAGTIQQGRFVDGVGGGISQFATTMFNAAFFAGLDFESYQSHSIYISRYPYGREATLSYPLPDLEVTNNTAYGMLIWTEYTDTSITVQLWSTPYYEVEETGQTSHSIGSCTRVETFRERTAPDGEVLEDMVFATYRPGEGLDCAGNPTPRPED